jgi:hypothetical protein
MAPGPRLQSTAFACPGCGQQVDPLSQIASTAFRLSATHNDLIVHLGPDGKAHACCNRNPLKPMPPAYRDHVE